MSRVLLIELSATIRHIQKNVLIKAGYDVDVASDFEAGLEQLRQGTEDGRDFDAAVIGWPVQTSPEINELFVLLEKKADAGLALLILAGKAVPAILNWIDARPNAAFLCWSDYKKSADTLAALHIAVGGALGDQVTAAIQPVQILFVDDSPTVRFKFRKLLRANGYYAETAASAMEGFEKALNSTFDIAIIDYFMPGATGDVLCRQLRDNPQTTGITSAIITGTYLDYAIKDALEAGAVECMFKNESEGLFLARVDAMSRHIRTRKSIEKERKRLGGILRSVGEGVYGVDAEGRISFTNPACMRMLGFGPDDRVIGESAHQLFHYADEHGVAVAQEECFLLQAFVAGESIQSEETVFWHKSGTPMPVECTVYPLTIEGKREGSVVAFRDISERKLREEELRWQAGHDALTKLCNRRNFEEQLMQEVERLKRSNEDSALLFIDLDRFKYVNDSAGHAAGDRLLVEIAQRLTSRLRHTDILARLGGDEFAIILRNVRKERVQRVADEYRKMLEQYMFVYDGRQYKVNGSIGIALMNRDTQSAEEVLANADIACNIAKGEGRNQIHLFIPDDDGNQDVDVDLGWSARLQNALENDHLVLHAQPVIPVTSIPRELVSGSVESVYERLLPSLPQASHFNELLLRLDDPVLGLTYPGTFLPAAERFNMMGKIDYWVVSTGLKKLALMQRDGYAGTFSINLSAETITSSHVIDDIEALITQLGIDSGRVVFEITEAAAVSDLIAANELISRLSVLGCRFALDDFGSGFSSFSHLKHLSVDFIKIDGAYVRGAATDSADRAIISSITDVAHSLGKRTIAEHVEDADTFRFMVESGVDYVQGYFISKPMALPRVVADPDHKADTDLIARS